MGKPIDFSFCLYFPRQVFQRTDVLHVYEERIILTSLPSLLIRDKKISQSVLKEFRPRAFQHERLIVDLNYCSRRLKLNQRAISSVLMQVICRYMVQKDDLFSLIYTRRIRNGIFFSMTNFQLIPVNFFFSRFSFTWHLLIYMYSIDYYQVRVRNARQLSHTILNIR